MAYFADTSFFIALMSRRDQFHSTAMAWNAAIVQQRGELVTTEAILWEWLNALADTSSRSIAGEGYRRIHADPTIDVIPHHIDVDEDALELYRKCTDKNWSITDCLSFVVMERRGLREALTADRHFEQAGFVALLRSRPSV